MWDRDNRTDRVFGSTGQTILPPFGGASQQQGELQYCFGWETCRVLEIGYCVNAIKECPQ